MILYAVAAMAYAANFTYDGINRRDPNNDLERNTIGATGEIFCKDIKTGGQRVSTGFFIDIGQGRKNSLLVASGHSFRVTSGTHFHTRS